MSRIVVLAGGSSSEREVSLRSGSAVAQRLERNGHDVTLIDPASRLDTRVDSLRAADAVFPALHGIGGEDGSLQRQLQDWGVTYVGSDAKASALCFDKQALLGLASQHEVLVPQGDVVNKQQFAASDLLHAPFVLKPNDGGSSIDTLIVRTPSQFDIAQTDAIFERHESMLLEELIDGTEITVGVLDDPTDGPRALPVIEIVPPTTGEFDYENKYNGQTQELCPPKHVHKAAQRLAQDIAVKIHQLAGCRDLSRSDFIVSHDDKVYFLETNTLPGMTEQSLYPKAAEASGLAMGVLVEKLVQLALDRHQPSSRAV